METLIVRSSEWLRNKGNNEDYEGRLHLNGTYCCLGLHARSCGISNETMGDSDTPEELLLNLIGSDQLERVSVLPDDSSAKKYFLKWLRLNTISGCLQHCEFTTKAMNINDSDFTDEQKIEALKELFKQVNIEIDWRPDE